MRSRACTNDTDDDDEDADEDDGFVRLFASLEDEDEEEMGGGLEGLFIFILCAPCDVPSAD